MGLGSFSGLYCKKRGGFVAASYGESPNIETRLIVWSDQCECLGRRVQCSDEGKGNGV